VGTYVRGGGVNVSQRALGSNADECFLELLGGDIGNSEGRVLGGSKGDIVGQETSNVGGSHGGTGNGVGSVLAADPSGENVQTRGEDVSALSEVGEVGTFISQGGGTDGDSLLGGSRRVVASISVVITGSDSEVNSSINSGVDSEVQSAGAATTKRHIGNATFEFLVTRLGLLDVSLGSPLNTLDNIGHGARAVRAEDLDSVDVGLLGNTVLLAGNSTRAVGSVAVSILIGIALRDSLAPVGTTLKVSVLNVGTSVNHVGINTLTAILGIEVLVEGTEGEALTMRDTGKTPGGVLLGLRSIHGADLGVLLNVLNLLIREFH
jgi:hypothetical protein